MGRVKVGCCGFPVGMGKYFSTFPVVEINSTFYKYPEERTVKRWRERAPEEFEFTVKANREISHEYRMEGEECLKAFEKMRKICELLNANVLLIQTPASFRPDKLPVAEKFLSKVAKKGVSVVWETRGDAWLQKEVRKKLAKILKKTGVTHVTDPFVCEPVYVKDFAYFRLHGLGERMYYWQFTDEELKKLADVVKKYSAKKDVYVFFNNLSMFEDARRFDEYLRTGTFPKVGTLEEVVRRTKYPTTKSMLMRRIGWKIAMVGKEQVRIGDFIAKLPSKKYETAEEVLKELEKVV